MTRTIWMALLLGTLVVVGTLAYSAYGSITRFAESVSYPERVERSVR